MNSTFKKTPRGQTFSRAYSLAPTLALGLILALSATPSLAAPHGGHGGGGGYQGGGDRGGGGYQGGGDRGGQGGWHSDSSSTTDTTPRPAATASPAPARPARATTGNARADRSWSSHARPGTPQTAPQTPPQARNDGGRDQGQGRGPGQDHAGGWQSRGNNDNHGQDNHGQYGGDHNGNRDHNNDRGNAGWNGGHDRGDRYGGGYNNQHRYGGGGYNRGAPRFDWHNNQRFHGYYGARDGFYFFPGMGYYNVPSQWYGHRWMDGEFLPDFFYNYRLYDWQSYDLPVPPYGTAWYFVGEDAVLVDLDTDRIIDVIYDVY